MPSTDVLHFSDKTVNNYRLATDTATIDEKYNDTPALNASLHWVAGREPCRGETPLELRQQPSVLSFPFVVISFPMKGGFVSMETTMKKTTSPIVREYKIGDITYIVKAVVKDGAKEDAVTKVRRLIQNDLRGKKVTNNFEPA